MLCKQNSCVTISTGNAIKGDFSCLMPGEADLFIISILTNLKTNTWIMDCLTKREYDVWVVI